jgi:hypothetical protein
LFDGGGLSERSRTRTRTRRESQRKGWERKKAKKRFDGQPRGSAAYYQIFTKLGTKGMSGYRRKEENTKQKKVPNAAGVVIAGLLVVPHPGLYIQYSPPPP